ncbi:site-2 protease family protein [Bacillaceae bacterium S4-13-58]
MSRIPPIHIHPLLWLMIGIAWITGSFWDLIIIYGILFIHEWGHGGMALFFRWKIHSMTFFPFGGKMETDEFGHRPAIEEILVILAGPATHISIFIFAALGQNRGFLSPYLVEQILYYNQIIFIFNLLPIWPLDGGKLVFEWLSVLKPYKDAYEKTIMLSVCCLLLGSVILYMNIPFSVTPLFMIAFLLYENKLEWKHRTYQWIRHLMSRTQTLRYEPKIQPLFVDPAERISAVVKNYKKGYQHPVYVLLDSKTYVVDERAIVRAYLNGNNKPIMDLITH